MCGEPLSRRGGFITSQSIQQTYDRFSFFYDLCLKPLLEFGRRDALEKLDLYRNDRVLEIGVGTGLSFEFYPPDVNVVGFDYSKGMLQQSRFRTFNDAYDNIHLFQMDAEAMAFPDNTFDRIFAAYVMTVVPDTRKAVQELLRVAKPGAKVVLINHLRSQNSFLSWFENAFHPIFSGIGLFSLDKDLLSILESCGVKDIEIFSTSIFRLHYIISFSVPAA